MDMVDEDDLNFLNNAISNKSYNLLKQIRLNEYEYLVIFNKIIHKLYMYIYCSWF